MGYSCPFRTLVVPFPLTLDDGISETLGLSVSELAGTLVPPALVSPDQLITILSGRDSMQDSERPRLSVFNFAQASVP